jgi:hypothetical protein
MILIDTSVVIDYARGKDAKLVARLPTLPVVVCGIRASSRQISTLSSITGADLHAHSPIPPPPLLGTTKDAGIRQPLTCSWQHSCYKIHAEWRTPVDGSTGFVRHVVRIESEFQEGEVDVRTAQRMQVDVKYQQ